MNEESRGWRPVASLTRWGAVELAGRLHLVGGHESLPAGHWVIRSPVRFLDLATAVTASSGRFYRLLEPMVHPGPSVSEIVDRQLIPALGNGRPHARA